MISKLLVIQSDGTAQALADTLNNAASAPEKISLWDMAVNG